MSDRLNFQMMDNRLMVCYGHHPSSQDCDWDAANVDTIEVFRKRIAELECALSTRELELKEMHQHYDVVKQQLTELKQHCQLLREVMKELADDVEAYADVDRHGRFAYPHIMAKWERDMEPVNRARALLKQAGGFQGRVPGSD